MLKVLVALQNLLAEPLRRDDRGATAVEYGLILVFIAVVIIAGLDSPWHQAPCVVQQRRRPDLSGCRKRNPQ